MPKISLIATFRNEEASLPTLLASIEAQVRPPDEVVFVDGGSGDGTVTLLQRWAERQPYPVRILIEPGCNIAAGRNLAIAAASHPIIAVTDGGVTLEPGWLAALAEPFAGVSPPDVVAGVFQGRSDTAFEAAMSATVLPLPEELREDRFLPSSRSVAFTRAAWERVGGYPEWADYCEDLLFDMALVASGHRLCLARSALVHFRPRGSLSSFWRQYRNYAMGDGQTGILARRHLLRYATYLVLVPALAWATVRRPIWGLGFLLGGALYLRRPLLRLGQLTTGRPLRQRVRAALWIPVLRLWGDLAKMGGYPRGLPHGRRFRETNRTYREGRYQRPASSTSTATEGD